ncbi:MAG: TetR/AcrR family transcriptional regulator [Candidatus Kapaibacterium sp.]
MSNSEDSIRKRILDTARDSFFRKGFSGTKTNALATELGISKRTLYQYFSSKKDLFDQVIERELDMIESEMRQMRERIAREDEVDFIDELSKIWQRMTQGAYTFTKEFYTDLRRSYPEANDRLTRFRREQIMANFNRIHTLGVKKGFIKSHINQKVLFLIHQNATEGLLAPGVLEDLPVSMHEVITTVFEVVLVGSLTNKGHKELVESDKFEIEKE